MKAPELEPVLASQEACEKGKDPQTAAAGIEESGPAFLCLKRESLHSCCMTMITVAVLETLNKRGIRTWLSRSLRVGILLTRVLHHVDHDHELP